VTDDPFRNALILTGPTASGKSALALELAPRLNAEIVSMDSMTLYRGMDIGTAKPTPEERSKVPHHLIDILDPWESANVAWWLDQAADTCRGVEGRGKRPLFVGGTPFYLKALLFGLFPSPPASGDLRRRLEGEAEQLGREQLHSRLAAIDPVTAARLHPNDLRRVVRALEVWELTGKPISAWQRQGWWHEDSSSRTAQPEPPDATARCVAVDVPRPILYERINRRVENMFALGWVDEVRRLRALPQPLSREASQALGYREIREHLDGKRDLQETVGLIQMHTRQFAKRQLTWLRHLPGAQLCDAKLTFTLWAPKMVDVG
jgi:tRNA dimethylallyltransferase